MVRQLVSFAAFLACSLAVWLAVPLTASAQASDPAEVVRAHFAAITAEDYTGADDFFSAAFIRSFKADVNKLNYYYLVRQAQLAAGYEVTEVAPLADENHDTMLVVVEFGPINPDAFVTATERMHYYLIREKAPAAAPLRDSDGMAWRIDIFDALRFDSLADARRRPYLYTRDSWDDDTTRELRSRQGMYRVYLALESFKTAEGQYPLRLLGGDNRRDELIAGGYLQDRYPVGGFSDAPMTEYGVDRNHAGDFAYYSVDADGDGVREAFWLLLHGKDQTGFYYTDRDIIYIINHDYGPDQRALAEEFAGFWQQQRNETLALRNIPWEQGLAQQLQGVAGAAADALERTNGAPVPIEQLRPAFPGVIAPRAGAVPGAEHAQAPAAPAGGDDPSGATPDILEPVRDTLQASAVARQVAVQLAALAGLLRSAAPAAAPAAPEPAEELEVHSYGM